MTPAETAIRAALAAGPTPGLERAEAVAQGRYAAIRGSFWWHVKIGDGQQTVGKCHSEDAAERLAAALTTAFLDGAYLAAEHQRSALAELLAELDGERARSQMFADLVRAIAVVLHGPGYSDTSKLAQEVAKLKAERDVAKDALSAEMDAHWRLRETGGALNSESMTEFVERLIAENKALKAERKPLTSGDRLWLWRDGDRYLAFRHEFPCYSPGGDPMTLGNPEPAVVEFRESHDRASGITGD